MSRTKLDRKAQVIVTASVKGDREAAKQHKVSQRTVRRWRAEVEDNDELAELVRAEKAARFAGLDDEINAGIRDAVAFMRRAFKDGDPQDPHMLHAVAGAFKLLSEAETTRRVLDVRLARTTGTPGAQHLQVVAGGKG